MSGLERARHAHEASLAFDGYQPPTSSTTYTPNQFFDVVLPNASRGCVRLVAYLIQKTLRISDKDGNPMYPEAHASYRELSDRAGIGRGRVKEAIDEAIERRYIDRLQLGRRHLPGEEGQSAIYSLRWDDRPEYVKDPEAFNGFFQGQGNYTRIPNDFFDHTIRNESLSLVRVVGVIIRYTIGWQQKVGFRRQQVQLSFTEIMRRSGIASRSTVNLAIKEAIEGNHIERVEEGLFDPFGGVATVWGVKWTDSPRLPIVEPDSTLGPKIETGGLTQNRDSVLGRAPESNQSITPGIEPRRQARNRTRERTFIPESNQNKDTETEPGESPGIEPGSGPKSNRKAIPNRTSKETTLKGSPKQQTNQGPVVDAGDPLALLERELRAVGVTPTKARQLVQDEPAEVIRRQLDWLPRRVVKKTAAGLIIACIEMDLPEPDGPSSKGDGGNGSPAWAFAKGFYEGLSGGEEPTLAEPTGTDARRASAILEGLSAKDLNEPGQAGKRFGSLVREKERGKSNPVRMLSLAITLYGDQFVGQAKSSDKALERRSVEEARKAHEERFLADYEGFVASLAERLDSNEELLDAFEAEMAKKLTGFRRMSERAAQMLEDQLRDDVERSRLLVEFAKSREAIQVPSFWEWDRLRNDHGFEAGA